MNETFFTLIFYVDVFKVLLTFSAASFYAAEIKAALALAHLRELASSPHKLCQQSTNSATSLLTSFALVHA
jgi:hypothetical protein